VRVWRLALLILAGLLAAAASTVLAVALNVATGGTARWFPAVERHPLWWTAGATVAVAGAGLLTWWAQRWYDRGLAELVPAVQQPPRWVVGRPAEVRQVVAALGRGGTVGITTAVQGAGGFGKTTIAKMARCDRRLLRRFRGRVYWVTVGRDTVGDGLALLVNGLIARIDPGRALTAPDVVQAAEQLAAVLASGPARLLVLDDVWTDGQLDAFPLAGRAARLVTTRNPSLGGGSVIVPVRVDQMSQQQALALLQVGLPPLPHDVAAALIAGTGRWPLLLRLAGKALAEQVRLGADATEAAEKLLVTLRQGGKLEMGDQAGPGSRPLDVADPDQRSRAVRATIEASTGLLSPADRARLAELAVFAEDEDVPVRLVAQLWQAADGLDETAARALCARLADLALLSPAPGGGTVAMHDVIRDYLRGELGPAQLAQLHQVLLDTTAKTLPAAAAAGPGTVTAWWELPGQERYLREHLIEHMLAGGRPGQAEQVTADLRWVDARLRASGPAAPSADLALIGTPRAERLRRVLAQQAHLLAPTDPRHSLTDVLYSRVSQDPDWGPQAKALAATREQPALASVWPLPDLARAGLLRTLAGHTGSVSAVAIAPDGTWLATISRWSDETVRIWDPATGAQRAVLTGHTSWVSAVAIAPDGTWLATGDNDGTVRIWDPATGAQPAVLTGHTRSVSAVAIAPDGTWLATGDNGGTVRIWDPATGAQPAVLTGHTSWVSAVAIAPDGTWLATSGGYDGTVRIWDAATGRERAVLAGHTGAVRAVAIAPDGTWLAAGGDGGTVRIWDPATGRERLTLAGRAGPVRAVAIPPDGTWLATGGDDRTVRIWDPATGRERAVLAGHTDLVREVAIAPDGTWLATSSYDGTVRIWDPVTGRERAVLAGHTRSVGAVAIAPDGTWLATGSDDQTVRIWDPATGQSQVNMAETFPGMDAIAFAPDGTWLATGGDGGTVRIWDPATGRERLTLAGHIEPVGAVAIAPDGTWLAAGSYGGTVRIWDPATGRERLTLTGDAKRVSAVAFAPDGTWLATAASYDGTVRIWDAATGRERLTLTGHTDWVDAVAIAPDGTWLATGSDDQTVRIWDPTTGRERAVLAGHTRSVGAVAIAPDGTWLATAGSGDATVRIWDPTTGRERAVLAGHTSWVSAVAIAPDGTWLAAGSGDGTVRIWDAATGRERLALTGHTGAVKAVAFAPDGTWLAAGSDDGTVRIWDPTTGSSVAAMRVDSAIRNCVWSPAGRLLAVTGDAGLYVFAFDSVTPLTMPERTRQDPGIAR
jgi:WD40 repeat protein